MKNAILVDVNDNVATVTSNIDTGQSIRILNPEGSVINEIISIDPVPFGHKIAVEEISNGNKVTKYGEIIGVASSDISIGQWVHVHNLVSSIGLEEAAQ